MKLFDFLFGLGSYQRGFDAGYKAAWDSMMPTIQAGIEKAAQIAKDKAIMDTLKGLKK